MIRKLDLGLEDQDILPFCKEEKMNIGLNLKESQLESVLEVLGKAGDNLDVVINIEDEESRKKVSGLTSIAGEWLENQEKEGEDEEEGASEQKNW